ncbi:NTP transferase domain-containing protein [Zhihengliuella sp.]|uniref:molybdenum cofactor guanylyltransferase n=1 Tax=Zhihengliuella sp. TaxID=1954483 RepID=UPI002811A869|nr:NTP transferase domain-containing protein [Zhihengliuella sp.]
MRPWIESVVLLAGGRGSRLGGAWKALLVHDGATLLSNALGALAGHLPHARVVVVGPDALQPALAACPHGSHVRLTREEPPFAGPLAAVAAGVAAAESAAGPVADPAPDAALPGPALTLLLAVDYIHPEGIVAALAGQAAGLLAAGHSADASGAPGPDALVPLDASGRQQPLASLWRSDSLRRALEAAAVPASGTEAAVPLSARLADAPMRRITRADGVVVRSWRTADAQLFDDVDTWEDAAANGIGRGSA